MLTFFSSTSDGTVGGRQYHEWAAHRYPSVEEGFKDFLRHKCEQPIFCRNEFLYAIAGREYNALSSNPQSVAAANKTSVSDPTRGNQDLSHQQVAESNGYYSTGFHASKLLLTFISSEGVDGILETGEETEMQVLATGERIRSLSPSSNAGDESGGKSLQASPQPEAAIPSEGYVARSLFSPMAHSANSSSSDTAHREFAEKESTAFSTPAPEQGELVGAVGPSKKAAAKKPAAPKPTKRTKASEAADESQPPPRKRQKKSEVPSAQEPRKREKRDVQGLPWRCRPQN